MKYTVINCCISIYFPNFIRKKSIVKLYQSAGDFFMRIHERNIDFGSFENKLKLNDFFRSFHRITGVCSCWNSIIQMANNFHTPEVGREKHGGMPENYGYCAKH